MAALAGAQTPDTEALLKEAIGQHQAGNIQAAIDAYRKYLALHPNSVVACSNLGAAYAKSARYQDAIVQYRHALKLQPGNGAIQMNLGLAYYKTGQIQLAAAQLEDVHRLAPGELQPVLLLADCWLSLGRNKKVIDFLTPIAGQRADDLAIAYLLGTALIRDNQITSGQVVIDRILHNGDSAEARLLLGTAKLNAKDFPAALADLAKAVELNPNLPDVYTYRGQALLSTGDSAAAAADFRKALAANPNDFNSNVYLAVLLKEEQHFDEAEKLLQHAIEVRPHDPLVRYQLATIGVQKDENLPRVQHQLEDVVKEVPAFTEAHVALATVYYRLKLKAEGDRERVIVQRLNREAQAKQQQGIDVK